MIHSKLYLNTNIISDITFRHEDADSALKTLEKLQDQLEAERTRIRLVKSIEDLGIDGITIQHHGPSSMVVKVGSYENKVCMHLDGLRTLIKEGLNISDKESDEMVKSILENN